MERLPRNNGGSLRKAYPRLDLAATVPMRDVLGALKFWHDLHCRA